MSEVDLGRYTMEEVRAYWDRMVQLNPVPQGNEGEPHVTFRLGKAWFAILASVCKAVEVFKVPSPLPVLPPHIMGVSAIRGRPVSVTDLGIFFGQKPAERGGHLLLIGAEGEETALKADWVDTVIPIDLTKAEQPPSKWRSLRTGLVKGAVYERNTLYLVLDPARCIKAQDNI